MDMKNNKDKIEKISEERKNYLSKVKNRKLTIILTQIGIIIAFIALWEILARLGKIDSFIMSQPSRIVKTFLNLSSNDLLKHVAITVLETIVRIYFRNSARSNNCCYFMVVSIYI